MADTRRKILLKAQKLGIAGFLVRLTFNLSPVYRRTGGKVIYVSEDLKEIRIKIPLSRKTKNYVGTIFGGSQFSATDPVFMFQLINILGDDYVVWDKATCITFKRPGKSTLENTFIVEDNLIERIKREVEKEGTYTFKLPILLTDQKGKVVSESEKSIYVASKEHYQRKRKSI